jgi:2-phosphoglycerate kinase
LTEPRRLDPLPLGGAEGPPYSKGLMARALMATGLPPTPAYELARRLEVDLSTRNGEAMSLDRIEEVAVELLGENGRHAADRLRRYGKLQELDAPIVLLIGGATGTGKSTIATEAAYRLGITRVTSTDFIRQTMRAFFSREFMPSVHHSSFEARLTPEGENGPEGRLPGFLDQTRNVLVGVRAALDRALHEGWSMVIEGVHLVPGMVPLPPTEGAVVTVQCVVAIDDEENHLGHFQIRDVSSEGLRPLEKYVSHFADIRALQDYIVERARRSDVPVVMNTSPEAAVGEVIGLVLDAAEQVESVS